MAIFEILRENNTNYATCTKYTNKICDIDIINRVIKLLTSNINYVILYTESNEGVIK